MDSELELLQALTVSAIIFTAGNFILVVVDTLQITIEIEKKNGRKLTFIPAPAKVVAYAFWILTIGGLIQAIVDTRRLEQVINTKTPPTG